MICDFLEIYWLAQKFVGVFHEMLQKTQMNVGANAIVSMEKEMTPHSRGSSQPRGQTHISCIGRSVLYH